MNNWHAQSVESAVRQLSSDAEHGLASDEAAARLRKYGPNQLVDASGRSPWEILAEQFRSAMIWLLVAAGVVSFALGERIDAAAIFAIILLNAVLGFAQDFRAERALAALKRYAAPKVRVRRDGVVREIDASKLVPGDVVLVEAGSFSPADCRLLESAGLRMQEASLTGESAPVDKQTGPLADDLGVGDQRNMLFLGTTAAAGRGTALVVRTGMETELGRIARSLRGVHREPTPLQRRLGRLGRTLAIVAIGIVAVVFVLGVARGESPRIMLMTALSLAVAVVPEGLPAVAAVALAVGAKRMFECDALIRKLPAVETLGSVSVICSDKTGTLTENRMTVTTLHVAGRSWELDGDSNAFAGDANPAAAVLLACGALCNDVEAASSDDEEQSAQPLGDPTETALVAVAAKCGLTKSRLAEMFPRVDEVGFDSVRKRMTTVHAVGRETKAEKSDEEHSLLREFRRQVGEASRVVLAKGAVDSLLPLCSQFLDGSGSRPLDDDRREQFTETNNRLAAEGVRVLGFAFRLLDSDKELPDAELEEDLVYLGAAGMIDLPRPEVFDAVARCRTAGVRPIMITGDHPLTAQSIAEKLGISNGRAALVGRDLAKLSEEQLLDVAEATSVFARVAPEDKMRIVQALQHRGLVTAMTGDGVNDAPALKQAHIGVAMGVIGTDVAREAADMVLLDDNFATIVLAVEEGRIVYDNILKFIRYTMTSNAGEVVVMVVGPLLGMPLPLLPLQILWTNLVTDGLPGLALAVEPAESDTMRRPPIPASLPIIDRSMWISIATIGLLLGGVSLAFGYVRWAGGGDERTWRTIVFTVLTLSQIGNALAIRSARQSLWQIGLASNWAMVGAALITVVLQLLLIYSPPLQAVFHTTALSALDLGVCLLLSTVVLAVVEAQKALARRRDARPEAN